MMKWIQNIRHNCKEATQLALKKEEMSLNWKQSIQLRIHLFICKNCRRFLKQNKIIQQFTEALLHKKDVQLNPDQIHQIKNISKEL